MQHFYLKLRKCLYLTFSSVFWCQSTSLSFFAVEPGLRWLLENPFAAYLLHDWMDSGVHPSWYIVRLVSNNHMFTWNLKVFNITTCMPWTNTLWLFHWTVVGHTRLRLLGPLLLWLVYDLSSWYFAFSFDVLWHAILWLINMLYSDYSTRYFNMLCLFSAYFNMTLITL